MENNEKTSNHFELTFLNGKIIHVESDFTDAQELYKCTPEIFTAKPVDRDFQPTMYIKNNIFSMKKIARVDAGHNARFYFLT